MKKVIALLALFSVAVFAQNTFTDPRDGKKYKSVKIGKQTWMAQNLDYHGEDGFLGLCYGDQPRNKIKKPENCQKYGRLYDWDEAIKACPKGWHLPTPQEWQTLMDFISDGGKAEEKVGMMGITELHLIYAAGKKLKSKSGWKEYDFSKNSPNNPKCKWTEIDNRGRGIERNECAMDEYGFSALPGGRGTPDGDFSSVGEAGYWWSNSGNGDNACQYWMHYAVEYVTWNYGGKSPLYSVRCLQD